MPDRLLEPRNRSGVMMLDIRLLAKGKRITDFDDLDRHESPLDEGEGVDIRRL